MIKFVYLVKLSESGYYKIGHTKNINKRIKELSTGNAEEIILINKYSSKYYKEIENYIHNIFKIYRIKGEWFNLCIEDEIKFIDMCKLCENNLLYLELNKI